MTTPVVGISTWRRTLDTYLGPERLHTLSTHYVEAVTEAGMTPILLPNGREPGEAKRMADMIDGLLLSGGDDVDPSSYGEAPVHVVGGDAAVDRYEIALVEAVRDAGTPLLAICRGMQLLNVALGGSLAQDVTAADTPAHRHIGADTPPEELNARRHEVSLAPGSRLASLYGEERIEVNTLHHQGIGRLADRLDPEGRTGDGLIEAVSYRGDWWALGVQWHPERMGPPHRVVFESFESAIQGRPS